MPAGKLIALLQAHQSTSPNDPFNYLQPSADPGLTAIFHDLSLVLVAHERNDESAHYTYRCTSSPASAETKQSPPPTLPEAYCEFMLTIVLQDSATDDDRGTAEPTMTSFTVKVLAPLSQTAPDSMLARFFDSCIGEKSSPYPSVAPHNDLVSALHGAASFARLTASRAAILAELTSRYGAHPKFSTWPHGSTYAFAPPQESSSSKNSCLAHKYTFLLSWSVSISPITKSPTADAFSKVSAELAPVSTNLSPTEQEYVKSFPKAFKALIKLNGLVKAVEVCHKLLYT